MASRDFLVTSRLSCSKLGLTFRLISKCMRTTDDKSILKVAKT